MATWKTVCELAAALPGTELGSLHGAPCWRVRGRVLVQLGPRLRVPDEDEVRSSRGELVMVAVAHDERDVLMGEDPDTFFITPHQRTSKLVLLWLERISRARLRELLVEAWRHRASKQMIRELETTQRHGVS